MANQTGKAPTGRRRRKSTPRAFITRTMRTAAVVKCEGQTPSAEGFRRAVHLFVGPAGRTGAMGFRVTRPAGIRFQLPQEPFERQRGLRHSPQSRETVERISQFAMLFRVCDAQ
jgi:hypothetical protein